MAAHNEGTKHYSQKDAARKSPRLSGATMLAALQERVRIEAERRGLSFSAALAQAAEMWLQAPTKKG